MALSQISLDSDILARLETLAASLSLSKEDALHKAVEAYLEDSAFKADVAAGRDDVQRGDVYPAEEVEAYFSKKRDQLIAKQVL